jgi:ATP-dependent protease ClpP protease subunit
MENEQNVNQNMSQQIQESVPVVDAGHDIHCLTIIGQIEGHVLLPPHNKTTKYEHVLPALVAIQENPAIKGLLLLLNTAGGDVEAGLAIAELVAGLSKPTVSLVLGGGHSIGVPMAVSADYTFIASSATMTIHPISMSGMVFGMPQTYEYLNRMQDRICDFIVAHSRIDRPALDSMLYRTGQLANDVGTILVGTEAVSCGLIDEGGTLQDALRKLRSMIDEREKQS